MTVRRHAANGPILVPRDYVYDPSKPFNEQTRRLIRKTHPSHGPLKVVQRGKRFAILADNAALGRQYMDIVQPVADGIGTKGALHWRMGTVKSAVQDAMAMTLDDLAEGGYVPMWLSNVAIYQKEVPERIHAAVSEMVRICMENRWHFEGHHYPILITGGETAIVNTVQGMEISMFVSGRPKQHGEIFPMLRKGDIIVGLDSNGIHSNGLSFLVGENGMFTGRGMGVGSALPWGVSVGEELTRPTPIYLPAIMAMIDQLVQHGELPNDHIHGMVHVTGGGMSKLTELLPQDRSLDIVMLRRGGRPIPELFRYVQKEFKVSSTDMYSRFNNGVGYAIAVDQRSVDLVLRVAQGHGFGAGAIGVAKEGGGVVHIKSAYDNSTMEFGK